MPEPGKQASELVARIALKDKRAMQALYERLAPHALALARRLVGRLGEAEDVVQEAFIEVWKRADQFDPRRGSGEAWVFGIVRNRAIDRLRHRTVVLRVLPGVQEQALRENATVTPLEEASARQTRQAVILALGDLPQEQRAALELAYYEGLSHSQIAARTGDPLGTVKTRIRAAMEKLQKLLTPHRPDPNRGGA